MVSSKRQPTFHQRRFTETPQLMKQKIKKWAFRLTVTALIIVTLLLIIVLNPVLTYANKTVHNNYTIFHNQPIDSILISKLDQATTLLQGSELYNNKLKLPICLHDGSTYPQLMQAIRGQAFAWGFYNKVVLQGTANYKDNYVELNGYKWNLTQLLAHEITHCLQFYKLGFWKAKPIANIPDWKWEGYAEYIARKGVDQNDLSKNITRLLKTGQVQKNSWAITFADSTISPRKYYNYWILMQYCMGIKKRSYLQILKDASTEEVVRKQMMRWYSGQQ